ncbi:hypothetical protein T10_167 [Trichinella papuae]|uniref:Uncharacterized protein n=1 Tax=Trichinella papuae TaxID=268474 RepID=A0A0V1M3J5_9BILA|nr:hypothetical protein T10_167 [Trichinella papuae]
MSMSQRLWRRKRYDERAVFPFRSSGVATKKGELLQDVNDQFFLDSTGGRGGGRETVVKIGHSDEILDHFHRRNLRELKNHGRLGARKVVVNGRVVGD